MTTIAKHAGVLGESICADYGTLNNIVTRHETTIRARWLKKSVAQRRQILLEAWPEMPDNHRPDYTEVMSAFQNVSNIHQVHEEFDVGDKEELPSDAKIWPYINIEDFVKPKSLLIFLNARGRNYPIGFAHSETDFSPLGDLSGCGEEPELSKYKLQFSILPDPAHYGIVVPFDPTLPNFEPGRKSMNLCLRPSLLTLHVQQRVLQFLVACSRLILHDMTEDFLLQGPVQDEPPSSELELRSDIGHITFSDALRIAPYRYRGELDFSRLHEYLSALYTNAKDHIWALREDPSYFAEAFLDSADHQPETIQDRWGRVHPDLDSVQNITVRGGLVVMDAFLSLGTWRGLYLLSEKLQLACKDNNNEDFVKLMPDFYCHLQQAYEFLSRELRRNARCSPQIRKFFIRTGQMTCYPEVSLNPKVVATREQLHMLACFEGISENIRSQNISLMYNLLDHMDTVMRTSKTAGAMISNRVSEMFAQISVVMECAFQYELWKGTPQRWDLELNHDHSHDEAQETMESLMKLARCRVPVHLVNPMTGKLNYPVHKARSKARVEVMRAAEANLDKFWDAVDKAFETKTGVPKHFFIKECILEGRQLQRTPPWEDSKPVNKKSHMNSKDVDVSTPEMVHDETMQITGVFDKLSLREKVKPKTKGLTEDATEPRTDDLPKDNKEEALEYRLDKRSYKAIKGLFHTPSNDDQDVPKAVKWDEFKRAMVRIGFAAEKLQGSAWQFTPQNNSNIERPIQFHEPHPDSDIPYVMARRFGRRLSRVYGWSGDSFKLA